MNNSIPIGHRGPDDEGYFIHDSAETFAAIGMCRLAIIDLSTGHQPLFSADGKIVLVFNREI